MRMLRFTPEQYRKLQQRNATAPPPKASKYHNKRTLSVDGIEHASAKEAARWEALKRLQAAGEISQLKRQIPFELVVNSILICRYVCDFRYRNCTKAVIEDAKGHKTLEYLIKRKLMKAVHGSKYWRHEPYRVQNPAWFHPMEVR
jgi:hypothetical protein